MNISEDRLAELKKYPLDSRIKKLRLINGLKQSELAELLDCSIATISYWENSHSIPAEKFLIKLALIFDLPTDFFSDDEKN